MFQQRQSSLASLCRHYLTDKTKLIKGKLIGTKEYDPELMAILEENKRLKRDLKVAQEERDILKKATAYFAKHS